MIRFEINSSLSSIARGHFLPPAKLPAAVLNIYGLISLSLGRFLQQDKNNAQHEKSSKAPLGSL